MTIIEADGENTQPLLVNNITIYAGQRYSFVLNANQTVDNYRIRAEPNRGIPGYNGGINSAILRYAGAKAIDPTTKITQNVVPLKETDLHPLTNPAAPGKPYVGGADYKLNLNLGFKTGSFLINNATYQSPSVPVLLQILSGKTAAQDLLPKGSVYTLPPNQVVELSIPPGSAVGGLVSFQTSY